MQVRFLRSAALLAALACPLGARADDLGSLVTPGAAVRLVAPGVISGELRGRVAAIDNENLGLINEGHLLTIPREAISRLDVSTGQRPQWLKGMVIGAVFEGVGLTLTAKGDTVRNVALGVFSGAAVGALVGCAFRAENWSAVPLDRVRVGVGPTRGRGAQASVTWSF